MSGQRNVSNEGANKFKIPPPRLEKFPIMCWPTAVMTRGTRNGIRAWKTSVIWSH